MEIHFETISHKDQRYDTVGDYWKEGKVQEFRVSDMKNKDYEFLVFLHELIEQHLTEKRGIKEKDISYFDTQFEALRKAKPKIVGDQEPGHMTSAPYHKEHVFAEKIERVVAAELGVDWDKYDKLVSSL